MAPGYLILVLVFLAGLTVGIYYLVGYLAKKPTSIPPTVTSAPVTARAATVVATIEDRKLVGLTNVEFADWPFTSGDSMKVALYSDDLDDETFRFGFKQQNQAFELYAIASVTPDNTSTTWQLRDSGGRVIVATEDTKLFVTETEFYAQTGDADKVFISESLDDVVFDLASLVLRLSSGRALELVDGDGVIVWSAKTKYEDNWTFDKNFTKASELIDNKGYKFLYDPDPAVGAGQFVRRDLDDVDTVLQAALVTIDDIGGSHYIGVVTTTDGKLIVKSTDSDDTAYATPIEVYDHADYVGTNVPVKLPTKGNCRLQFRDGVLKFYARAKASVIDDEVIVDESLLTLSFA